MTGDSTYYYGEPPLALHGESAAGGEEGQQYDGTMVTGSGTEYACSGDWTRYYDADYDADYYHNFRQAFVEKRSPRRRLRTMPRMDKLKQCLSVHKRARTYDNITRSVALVSLQHFPTNTCACCARVFAKYNNRELLADEIGRTNALTHEGVCLLYSAVCLYNHE